MISVRCLGMKSDRYLHSLDTFIKCKKRKKKFTRHLIKIHKKYYFSSSRWFFWELMSFRVTERKRDRNRKRNVEIICLCFHPSSLILFHFFLLHSRWQKMREQLLHIKYWHRRWFFVYFLKSSSIPVARLDEWCKKVFIVP